MYLIGILNTSLHGSDFSQRIGKAFAAANIILAVMDGIEEEKAMLYRPEHRVASGIGWMLWWEGGDEPPALEAAVALVYQAIHGDDESWSRGWRLAWAFAQERGFSWFVYRGDLLTQDKDDREQFWGRDATPQEREMWQALGGPL